MKDLFSCKVVGVCSEDSNNNRITKWKESGEGRERKLRKASKRDRRAF
jgi:hypothetical protein